MNTMTVQQVSKALGLAPELVRRGITQGTLPGTVIRNDSKTRYVIPSAAFELYIHTGITPVMLAAQVMQAETPAQGIAYLRKVLEVLP